MFLNTLLKLSIAGVLGLSVSVGAQEDDSVKYREINLKHQSLSQALTAVADEFGLQIGFFSDVADGARSPVLEGRYTVDQAFSRLLEGTGLTYSYSGSSLVAIQDADGVRTKNGADSSPEKKGAELKAEKDLEELVITATRRKATNVQDVPIAISAIGTQRLENMGADQFEDFVRSIPGLTFNQTDSNQGNFVIRGITASIGEGDVQATVGTYIDDLPSLDVFYSHSKPDLRLFDVNRVEVLRGPQGTLFGSGSMSGAIRVITNKPDAGEFSGKTDVTLSNTQGGEPSYDVNAMINVPLIEDVLAARAVVYYRDRGGWIDNRNLGENRNKEEVVGGRFMLKYQPTEALSFTGTILHQDSTPEGSSKLQRGPDGELFRQTAVEEFTTDEMTLYNLVGEYDFGDIHLRSSTSVADKSVDRQIDVDAVTQAILGPDFGLSRIAFNDSAQHFVQELHLFSDGDDAFNWFVGAVYQKQDDRAYDFSWLVPGSEAVLGIGDTGAEGDNIYDWLLQSVTEEKAIFGELSYRFTDKLEMTVGARYFKSSFESLVSARGLLAGGATSEALAFSDSKPTYKYSLSYQLDDEKMLYVQAAEGYRIGSANPRYPEPAPPAYGPDNLWNYEIGAKTDWLNDRLRLNGALYFIDWKDMQLLQNTPSGYAYITNVGNTRSMGMELEVQAQLASDLEYIGAFSYNEAQIRVDNAGLNAVSGDRVPGTPHFNMSNSLDYRFSWTPEADGYLRVSHYYVGKSYSKFNRAASEKMGSYNMVNMRVGGYLDNWELSLFANNLFNSDAVVTAVSATGIYLLRPRTLGLNIRTRF